NILGAAAIGNVEDGAAVFAPHRPHFLSSAFADLFVTRLGAKAHQPNFALVDVAVALAPPLREAEPVPGESDRATIRRGSAEIFTHESVGGHFHRRPAIDSDAEDVVHP